MKILIYILVTIYLPIYFLVELMYLCYQLLKLYHLESKVFEAYEPMIFLHGLDKQRSEAVATFKRSLKNYYKRI